MPVHDISLRPSVAKRQSLDSDGIKKAAILQETYEFERQQRIDPQLRSKAITQGGLSRGLKLLLGEVIGLCKELDEDDFISLSRKTTGSERAARKRVVTITAPGRHHLSGLSSKDLESVREFRDSLKQTGEPGAGGEKGEIGYPGGPPSSTSESSDGVTFYGDTSTQKNKSESSSESPSDRIFNSTLVKNQAFVQSIEQMRESLSKTRKVVRYSNQLKVDNEELQSELVEFFDQLDDGLLRVVHQTDLSESPVPVEDNLSIKQWFEEEWPEAIDKLESYTSKKALADMLVPTGIVAAFGLVGIAVGSITGVGALAGFGGGSFLGMFATRQVSSKEARSKIDNLMDGKDDND